MKTKFSKLFVTILIVAAVTCCGALASLPPMIPPIRLPPLLLPRLSTPTMTTTAL